MIWIVNCAGMITCTATNMGSAILTCAGRVQVSGKPAENVWLFMSQSKAKGGFPPYFRENHYSPNGATWICILSGEI